ncbi:uncharacterized protein TNCV_3398571 [Trichonephila clavipes]|nr:uncharacterized protein TNCV_3398571 [Trichonephila clavipes]
MRRPSNGRNDYRGIYENGRQGNQWFESRNRFRKDDGRFNDRGDQFRSGNQKDDFSRGEHRNRGSMELPYVPILLNETFTKALWDTEVEKSFISEETYRKYFFYKPVKKSRTQVITAQGAKCQNIGIVELNVRIREFEKPWLFHVLADLEYPSILGVDFISGSKIILDFDRKSLAIPD